MNEKITALLEKVITAYKREADATVKDMARNNEISKIQAEWENEKTRMNIDMWRGELNQILKS